MTSPPRCHDDDASSHLLPATTFNQSAYAIVGADDFYDVTVTSDCGGTLRHRADASADDMCRK